jgi:hypothetical protein
MGTSETDVIPAGSNASGRILVSHQQDRALSTLALVLFAVSLSHAIDINSGQFSRWALFWLTVSIFFCLLAIVNPRVEGLDEFCRRWTPLIFVLLIAEQAYDLLREIGGAQSQIALAFGTITVLGLSQFFHIGRLRWPLMAIMVLAFCVAGKVAFSTPPYKYPGIDVFMFQSGASYGVMHGISPYAVPYPNVYPPNTPFYGPGIVEHVGNIAPGFGDLWHRILPEIVDVGGRYPIGSQYQRLIGDDGTLSVGCPYPPLSVLMAIPGYVLGGDVRYSHLLAMGLSAALIVLTRPTRLAALAATFLLLMPRGLYVLELSWTEPFLVLTFSLVMFCACRWHKALPIALGLYLSTKQYTILTVPLLPLLISGPDKWKTVGGVLVKAVVVVAVINLPFLIWDAHGFFRSLVEFQFMQSLRTDALSYLAFLHHRLNGFVPPTWMSLVPLVVVIPLSLRRASSSPAGFAAAVTAVHLLFFAFNKLAFCNYYYFVIGTACWGIGAARFGGSGTQSNPVRGFPVAAIAPGSGADE